MTAPWLPASPSHDTINAGRVLAWQGRERRQPRLERFLAEGDAPSITSLPAEGATGPRETHQHLGCGLGSVSDPTGWSKRLGEGGWLFYVNAVAEGVPPANTRCFIWPLQAPHPLPHDCPAPAAPGGSPGVWARPLVLSRWPPPSYCSCFKKDIALPE